MAGIGPSCPRAACLRVTQDDEGQTCRRVTSTPPEKRGAMRTEVVGVLHFVV